MLKALELIAALVGFFLLVPGIVWMSTGSRRQAVEAAKGYGWVVLVLFVAPAALGFIVVGVMQLMGS